MDVLGEMVCVVWKCVGVLVLKVIRLLVFFWIVEAGVGSVDFVEI